MRWRRHSFAVVLVLLACAMGAPAGAQESAPVCAGAPETAYDDADRIPEVHRQSVDCAAYQRLMTGSTDDQGRLRFYPRRAVTRAQMATMLINALVAGGHDLRLSDGAADRFGDIAASPHRANINRLADAGIAQGSRGGSFSPDAGVTRQQMASFVVATARFADDTVVVDDGEDRFGDVGPRNVHKRSIEAGADSRLFSGTSTTTFAPGAVVRRAPTATFGVTLLRRSGAADMLEPWEGFGRTTLELITADAATTVRVPAYDAATPPSRSRGLMDRDSLREDAGMVFRFPGQRQGGFWMKNTKIPLSIAYFDGDGRIVAIMDMEPCTADPCPTYDPGVPYSGALEVNQGFFERHGIAEGDTVRLAASLPPAR
jgi:uncharacterized protein